MNSKPSTIELIEALGQVAWSRDLVTNDVLYVSATMRAMLGVDESVSVDERALMNYVVPEDRAKFLAARASPQDISTFEFRFMRGSETRHATSSMRYIRDDAGRRVRADGIVIDITDLVRARESATADLRRAETLLSIASRLTRELDLAEVAKSICQETRRAFDDRLSVSLRSFDSVNEAYVLEHIAGVPAGGHHAPNAMSAAKFGYLVDAAKDGVAYYPDLALLAPNEAVAALRATGVRGLLLLPLMRGAVRIGLLVCGAYEAPLDLSTAEIALLRGIADQAGIAMSNAQLFTQSQASAQRYRDIVETAAEGIAIVDARGIVTFANEPLARMLDAEVAEVVGCAATDFLFAEDVARGFEHIRAQFGGQKGVLQWRLQSRKGREVWTRTNATVLMEEDKPKGLLVLVTDVTESRKLEEKLLQAQKLESLGLLAGGVAHDFNNLLASILGNAGLALMDLSAESRVRSFVDDIQTAALRAADLTKQLLAYSGRGRFVASPLDVGRVVQEMAHLLGAVINKGVAIEYRLMKELPAIEGDATQIGQIVMNLITNASDAIGDETGTITIATSVVQADRRYLADSVVDDRLAPGDYVCLEVSDTGAGMSSDAISKIFDPFYTTKFTGRGLGLAGVLGILRAHKGAIKVRSEVGKGTTFRVLFPVANRPAVGAAERQPSPRPARPGLRVLVVDDEPSVRTVARRILESAGYEVVVAADGVEGVEALRNDDRIAAVVLDVTMPRMGGEEACVEMRRIKPDVKVLLVSGYSRDEASIRFAGKGSTRFIEKPFLPETLLERVREILES